MIDKDKLVKLLNLTSSDADNEALTALRFATKMLKESNVTWDQILSGDLKEYKTTESKREYAKGYRAGFKNGCAARRERPVVVRRTTPQNMVQASRRVSDLINRILSQWDHLDPHQKHFVKNSMDFLRANHCLPVKNYDELMKISKMMWDRY